jgi:hypothetical protein
MLPAMTGTRDLTPARPVRGIAAGKTSFKTFEATDA